MTEKQFENKIKRFLKNEGAYFIKYWGGGTFTKVGVPDILACVGGTFFGIEVKAENGRASPIQIENIKQINAAGGIGLIVYPKDFNDLVRRVKECNSHTAG